MGMSKEQYIRALALENATRLVTSTEYMTEANGERVISDLDSVFGLADQITRYILEGGVNSGK